MPFLLTFIIYEYMQEFNSHPMQRTSHKNTWSAENNYNSPF